MFVLQDGNFREAMRRNSSTATGTPFKFDDIGCMVHFLRQRRVPVEPVAFFVTDYDQRNWLPAETASYEQSAQVPTPMASGLLAVDNRSRGEEYARRFHGQVLDFSRVLGP